MSVFKYISVVFFACVFALHGISTIFPGLFADERHAVENVCPPEEEPGKSAEKNIGELKEFYLNSIYPDGLFSINIFIAEKNTTPLEVVYKKDVHIAVSTPPPEFS